MLFRKSILKSEFLKGWTDCHCHILPGVDDGIQTMEDALAVLKYYDEQGVEQVWLTPHVMEDIPNRPVHLKDVFAELQERWKGRVKLNLAAENMIDSLFVKRLEKNDILLWGEKQDMMLVEASYIQAPMDFKRLLQRVLSNGIFPILAHPERYMFMEEDDYDRIHDMGVRFQLNIASLTGAYGPRSKAVAEELLEKGMYDMTGSDLHNLGAMKRFAEAKVIKKSVMEKLIGIKG